MTLAAIIAGLLLLVIGLAAPALGRLSLGAGHAHQHKHPVAGVYLMALASLASAWPVFGAIGAIARGDEAILGIFAAPVLALLLLRPVARRLQVTAHQQSTLSLPALISARYGRSPAVAIVSSLMAAASLGVLLIAEFQTVTKAAGVAFGLPTSPFIAGALPAVIAAGALLARPGRFADGDGLATGLILLVRATMSLALAVFVVLVTLAIYHATAGHGLSITPLWSLTAIGDIFGPPPVTPRFLTIVVIATLAVYVLPSRFSLTGKRPASGRRHRTASIALPILMVVLVGGVILICGAGLALISANNQIDDHLALALPALLGPSWLGGFILAAVTALATATACLAAASVASSLVDEGLSPWRARHHPSPSLLSGVEKLVAILYLSAICVGVAANPTSNLVDLGMVGLTGLALLALPLLGGLYIKSIKHQGVIAGLAAGAAAWFYTLFIPVFFHAGRLGTGTSSAQFIGWSGTAGIFSLPLSDPLTAGIIWTLITEIGVMAAVSVNTRANLIERAQADAFIDPGRGRRRDRQPPKARAPNIRIGELDTLLRRFLGDQVARETIREYTGERDFGAVAPQIADTELVRFAEHRLASVVGSSSAHWLLRSGSSRADINFNDVARVLDRTADAVQFNRGVLRAALENSDQGISVIDGDLRLVTWNSRYLTLFNYPSGLVRTGRHIAELIRFNAERGECGPGNVEDLVQRRLAHLRRAQPHRFERHRSDGTVLYMTGNPVPGGGFVTTFNDITAFKEKQADLARANARLEARVSERTAALSHSNDQLQRENAERARAEQAAETERAAAERANQSKTRFLAAASHDLLQPLNAARLFADAAGRSRGAIDPASITQIQNALGSAQALLEPLLDISKIDAGRWPVERDVISVDDVLRPLADQFQVIADEHGLRLDYLTSTAAIDTDPKLLRRIVQNLLSNAVRYTESGRIVLGVRRRPEAIEIQVLDTGPGISQEQKASIFDEFERGDSTDGTADRGLGLGLSLADRLASLLDHRVTVESTLGRGTRFSILIKTTSVPTADTLTATTSTESIADVHVEQALVVDDDNASRDALVTILASWGIEALVADPDDTVDIVADGVVDALIVDYDLGADAPTGLEILANCPTGEPACRVLASANRDPMLAERAEALGARVIYKPIDADTLAAMLGIKLSTGA